MTADTLLYAALALFAGLLAALSWDAGRLRRRRLR